MRVALLNQFYAPDEAATAQLLADLGEHLVGAGHEVCAICSSRAYADPLQRYPARESIGGVSVRRIWSTGFGRQSGAGRLLDYLSFFAGAAAALVAERRFDVVVSLSTPPMVALLGVLYGRLRGGRSLFWVMDIYPELAFELGVIRRESAVGRLFDALGRTTLRRSDEVVALGETMARLLADAGARDVHTVHNWADGEAIRPAPLADNELRATWGWRDRFVVLYSGNMGLAHEFDTVLGAAEILRDHEKIRFAFVGGGPRRPEVEREIARLKLPNVEMRPLLPREELGRSLTAGDVHLITLRPGLPGLLVPSKIYGVLAAGRPTLYVGPDEGEIADIVRGGQCGTTLAPGDAPGLARAILRYADNEGLVADEGRRARELFDRRFTRRSALDKLQQRIEAAAGRR